MRAIFVSYRRHDSEGEAGRLFDDLVEQFGENSVFMDVAAIEVGRDFRKTVDESVATCGVLLAIVGLGWLDEKHESGARRLEDPNDLVRVEIASALKRDIPLIPVLVRGAKMPRADQLPEDIRDLAYRNAVELTHVRWKSDIKLLIRSLRVLLGDSRDIVTARGVRASPDSALFGNSKPRGAGGPSASTKDFKATPGEASDPLAGGAQSADTSGTSPGFARLNSMMIQAQPALQPSSSPSGIAAANSATVTKPAADAPCSGKLDPEAVARITMELTDYIGPIAEVVVRRAAKQCASVVDLRRTVAEEIETSTERAKFLDACGAP